jgi:hypothetical protein
VPADVARPLAERVVGRGSQPVAPLGLARHSPRTVGPLRRALEVLF